MRPQGPALTTSDITPAAASYSLTPLLTGGVLTTERYVKLDQTISRTTVDSPCAYANGEFHVTDSNTASGLVDLGYAETPRASPAPPTSDLPDAAASGSYTFNGMAYACEGSKPVAQQGGTCTRSFAPTTSSIYEPQNQTLAPKPYTPGTSLRVVARADYDPGFSCLMYGGKIPMAPGAYPLDYWGDAQYFGSFIRPVAIPLQDSAMTSFDMAKTDTSCVNGARWWLNEHSTGIYVWTGYTAYGVPDGISATCSSVRSGFARTTVKRALAVTEVRLFQMTPAGGYAEVPPGEKVVDGNTVKVEMTIENTWKRSITAPIELQDHTYRRKLEPETGQLNPFTETFAPSAQKKVTFLWRTDGAAWEGGDSPVYTRSVDIMSPFGGARLTVNVAPRPALLVHGWNSSAGTWDPWPGFVSGVRSDWHVRAVQGMNTDPRNGTTIQNNAITLAGAIRDARAATGAVHVDLVAHSMGGLISRWFLSRLMGSPAGDARPVVRTLTMFGTPHLGSDCATGILQGAFVSLPTGELSAEASRWAQGSKWIPTIQLTPAYLMGPFRASTPKVRGVYYSHLSGNPIPYFACGAFGNQSGANDGAVVIPSSRGDGLGGTELAPPLAVPHITTPWPVYKRGMTADSRFFRLALTKVLGLGPDRAPRLVAGGAAAVRPAAVAPPIAAAVTVAAARGTVASPPVLRTPGGVRRVLVHAPPGVTVTVRGPNGVVLGRVSGGSDGQVATGSGAGLIRFTATGPSTAQLLVSLVDPARWFTVTAARSGSSIVVTATVSDGRATSFQAVSVSGTVVGRVITLVRSGTTFRATLPIPTGNAVSLIVRGTRGTAHRDAVIGV